MQTILIMEDDVRLATDWQLELESAGYAVIVTHNFESAKAALEDSDVSLVVCDMLIRTMPATIAARGGLSLLAFIRLHFKIDKRPPVIVVSGADESTNIVKYADSIQAGFTLKKPIDATELLASVNRVLGGCP